MQTVDWNIPYWIFVELLLFEIPLLAIPAHVIIEAIVVKVMTPCPEHVIYRCPEVTAPKPAEVDWKLKWQRCCKLLIRVRSIIALPYRVETLLLLLVYAPVVRCKADLLQFCLGYPCLLCPSGRFLSLCRCLSTKD